MIFNFLQTLANLKITVSEVMAVVRSWAEDYNIYMRVGATSFAISLVSLVLLANGCDLFNKLAHPTETFPPFGRFPDAILEVPVTMNTPETSFGAKATDINSSGRVIGYTNSWNPPSANINYIYPIVGFAINIDDSDYVDLTPNQAVSAWPLAINDAGLVVGVYRLNQGSYDVLHAYMIHEDGTGFVDIHPDGFYSSDAVDVTSSGMVIGHVRNGSDRHAVIFPANGYPLTYLGENYYDPSICAACDKYVVLSGWTEPGGEELHLLYRVEDKTTEILSVPDVPPGYVTIGAVADNGTMVGWYYYGTDYGAFSYQLGNDHAWVLNGDIRHGDWIYDDFRFCDFTSDGTIVGMLFRSTVLPQSRAAKYIFGVNDVEDVTPGEYSAYSELYSVNEDGWAVGYSGYSYGNENGEFLGVSDRAIAVRVK